MSSRGIDRGKNNKDPFVGFYVNAVIRKIKTRRDVLSMNAGCTQTKQ